MLAPSLEIEGLPRVRLRDAPYLQPAFLGRNSSMARTMLVVMNLVIVTSGGGNLSLVNAEDLVKSAELPRARKERYRAKRFLREWLTSSHSARPSLRSAGFRLEMADQLFHLERPVFPLLGENVRAWMLW